MDNKWPKVLEWGLGWNTRLEKAAMLQKLQERMHDIPDHQEKLTHNPCTGDAMCT